MTTPRPLYNASRRLAAYLGCGCGLLLAGCGNASDSNHPRKHDSKLVREPWSQITRAKHSTTLLINTDQETADRSSRCFIHYTTHVVTQTSHRISIELLAPDREAQPFRCPAKAVRGRFLVAVHLKKRYRGQRLFDPVTGQFHPLTPRTELY